MKKVKILDKEFEIFISYDEIKSRVEKIADQINQELNGENPVFLCVLNGAFMFGTELYKRITSLQSEISFVKLSSYRGVSSTGKVRELIGLSEDLEGRTVIIIEDIVDTGITMSNIIEQVKAHRPAEVKIATLLLKPDALQKEVNLDYVGFEIPNDFIVGYGLDYDGRGRNLKDIYTVVEE